MADCVVLLARWAGLNVRTQRARQVFDIIVLAQDIVGLLVSSVNVSVMGGFEEGLMTALRHTESRMTI